MRISKLLIIFALLAFAGCSTTAKKSGVEEVFQSGVLPVENLSSEMLVLQFPISDVTLLGDALGVYKLIDTNGKKTEQILVREFWRVVLFEPVTYSVIGTYPAMVDDYATNLWVIIPDKSENELVGKSGFVLSGSGQYIMPLASHLVRSSKLETADEIGKFYTNKSLTASRIQQSMLIDVSFNTKTGQVFWSVVKKKFPQKVVIGGKLYRTADFEAIKMATGELSEGSFWQKLLVKSNVSVSTVGFDPMQAVSLAFTIYASAMDNTLNGNFLEAQVSGYQAMRALGKYILNARQIPDLKEMVMQLMQENEKLKGKAK